MGCWNGTCGVTQLPIIEGDKVVLFLLEEEIEPDIGGEGFCSVENYYKQILMPIRGTYDGYGSISNIENGEKFVEDFQEYTENDDDVNAEELLELIKERKFFGMGFMLVHEYVYEKVSSTIEKRLSGAISHDLDSFIENIDENIESFENKEFISGVRKKLDDKSLKDFLFKISYIYTGDYTIDSFIISLGYKIDDEVIKKIYNKDMNYLKDIIQLLYFKKGMVNMRKLWIPQAGAGDQVEDYELSNIVGQFMLNKSLITK